MAYIDLNPALHDWPYEPDKISVRKILGNDGTVRIQMRIELGILQMNAVGRPDGEKPYGRESLLDYHQQGLASHLERNKTALGFGLGSEECRDLRTEASLLYRRYVAFFVLEEFAGVFHDTSWSLGILDICRDYGLEPEDRVALEEFRSYILMMDARARAYHALSEGEPGSALAHVNRGIMHIRNIHEGIGQSELSPSSEELRLLQVLGQEVRDQMPKDPIIVTRQALRQAVEQEHFEEAARLRDTLDNLYKKK